MDRLPHKLELYFIRDDDTVEIPLRNLFATRARPEGIRNARRYMALAAEGKMAKRKPISIKARPDGAFDIHDGNSTFAVAKAEGWPTILAKIIP